jgi:biopolymer transport protein ExbD
MISITEMQTMLDALKRAKYAGVRRVQFADRVVEYGSIAEIVRAIVDLEAEIAALATAPSSFTLATHSRD